MSRPSTSTLHDHVASACRNNGQEDAAPPRIAPTSPFEEVLIQDLLASAPTCVHQQLLDAETIRDIEDWMAVGVVLRWLPATAGRDFMQSLGGNPSRTPAVLSRLRQDGTFPRDAVGIRDLAGMAALQGVTALCLMALTLAFLCLVYALLPPAVCEPSGELAAPATDSFPLLFEHATGPLSAFGLFVSVFWFVAISLLGPCLFERIRRFSCRALVPPPSVAVRPDTFYSFWCVGFGVWGWAFALSAAKAHWHILEELAIWQGGLTMLFIAMAMGILCRWVGRIGAAVSVGMSAAVPSLRMVWGMED